MRTIDVIDEELRLLVMLRGANDVGGRPTAEAIDELLDERLRVGLSTPTLAASDR